MKDSYNKCVIRNDLSTRAFKNRLFARGGGEFIRTVPMDGNDAPYVGYIKTTIGESKVPYDNRVLFEVLVSGKEISEEEYNNSELTVLNEI